MVVCRGEMRDDDGVLREGDGDEGDPEELVREKKMMGKGVLSG